MSIDILTLRGFAEQTVDLLLSEESLAHLHGLFELFKPAVKDRKDAIFGFIVGYPIATVSASLSVVLKRPLKSEENHEVGKVIEKRTMEIRSRILETFT